VLHIKPIRYYTGRVSIQSVHVAMLRDCWFPMSTFDDKNNA